MTVIATEKPATESQRRVAGYLDAETKAPCELAFDAFIESYTPKYARVTDCMSKDRDTLLAFYDFPTKHWRHLQTSNPIESTFATLRHRTIRSKGCLSNSTALAMRFKLLEGAGLQPHRVRQFKLSSDPQFAAKLHEIVGLYVDPPDHAIVLSVDEKSQIQALDRTQPGLPMKKGRAGTMTHDYERHGVTTLFAALDLLEGKVIGQCMKRHRHKEFIRFLNVIEARVPKKKTIHIIIDNYATHKHPDVMRWLEKHRRFVFHFTPTSAS